MKKIRVEGVGKEVVLSRVTEINSETVEIFHLDKLKDDTFRLTYSKSLIPDIKAFLGLTLMRTLEIEMR